MYSNGESALRYFMDQIRENALYLLDEPENSLSIQFQQQLADFLIESTRFFGCQFIIATHSPILLAMPDVLIYDLDSIPVSTKNWTELDNVRLFFNFLWNTEPNFKNCFIFFSVS
ncbi:aaa ATPase [gut metagenome]|uniref:Aaa ATPase n=1 Tax=gut metagenome TaxID=749906 RepID=J9G2X1_9ZZZZ